MNTKYIHLLDLCTKKSQHIVSLYNVVVLVVLVVLAAGEVVVAVFVVV